MMDPNDLPRLGRGKLPQPARWWRHECPCAEPERTEAVCIRCGGRGEDLGWRVTDQDRDAALHWAIGFSRPAEGDTSSVAESIRARLVPCTLCDQTGLIQTHGPKAGWSWCPVCHGMGSAFDGRFTCEPPGQDIAASVAERLCSTGYMHGFRRGRSVRRDLDEAELAHLRAWLSRGGFLDSASVVPAILCPETGRLAVGPSYRVMLARDGSVRRAFDDVGIVRRGFVDLRRGRFLGRGEVWGTLRCWERPPSDFVILHPELLPYHGDVPCGVVRWRSGSE